MLLGIHHVQITIPKGGDNDARDFYCRVLGLREVAKPESLQGRGGFWLELGDKQIHVGTEDGVNRNATKAHVAYLVDDLESWRARLEAERFEILNGIPIPGYERFEFRDPFGNRVEMLEATSADRTLR